MLRSKSSTSSRFHIGALEGDQRAACLTVFICVRSPMFDLIRRSSKSRACVITLDTHECHRVLKRHVRNWRRFFVRRCWSVDTFFEGECRTPQYSEEGFCGNISLISCSCSKHLKCGCDRAAKLRRSHMGGAWWRLAAVI